ncbi:MAG: HlyD family efflux transporter periplasmic adaptor subunit [Candidatus Zixiibacteriota bacterium]
MPILLLAVGFLAMIGLLSLKKDSPKKAPEARAKVVETAVVSLHPVQSEIIAYGRVTSAQPVHLHSEVAGTIENGDIPFQPAQSFSKGDLLLKIDDRQARLDLNSMKSDLMTALATVLPEIKVDFPDEFQVWQDYFNNCQFDKKISPLPEAANQKIKLFLSRFNVYKLYFSVRDLEILLEKHYLYAAFDGSIVSADLRVGSTARNGSLLGEIINLEQMEVAVPIKAADIPLIDRSRPVMFSSSEMPGEWTGDIVRVGSNVDTRSQTVDVYISVHDGLEVALLNGVFLEAHITGKTIDSAFTLPPKAIYEDRFVYVIKDGKLATSEVSIVRKETSRFIVNGEIEVGDTVVIEAMQGVSPGMPASSRNAAGESRER